MRFHLSNLNGSCVGFLILVPATLGDDCVTEIVPSSYKAEIILNSIADRVIPKQDPDPMPAIKGGWPLVSAGPIRSVAHQLYDAVKSGGIATEVVAVGFISDMMSMHEVCHISHQAKNLLSYDINASLGKDVKERNIMQKVSQYASWADKPVGQRNEFIAETCAAKIAGMTIDSEVEEFYTAIGGQAIPEVAKLIKKSVTPLVKTGSL